MKKFLLIILIGASIVFVGCKKGNKEKEAYVPFKETSSNPFVEDYLGYREEMGIKKILSTFDYGPETRYDQETSYSMHYFEGQGTQILSGSDLDLNYNYWEDKGKEVFYYLHAPGIDNYQDFSLYSQLRLVYMAKGNDGLADLSLRIFDEDAGLYLNLGTVTLDANERHELIFPLSHIKGEKISKISFCGSAGYTNRVYYIDLYNPESPKRNVTIEDLNFETEYLGNVISGRLGPYSSSGFFDEDDKMWKMWFGKGIPEAICSDNVYYIETKDPKLGWSLPVRIIPKDESTLLFPYDQAPGYGGDPSVIKVEGTYYMYFSGIVKGTDGVWPHHNDVFVARSTDGINFTVYEKPVVPSSGGGSLGYGNGAPSVVYKDGLFYLYYYSQGEKPGGFKLRISEDGLNFGEDIYCFQDFVGDIKYVDEIEKWIGIYYTERAQEGASSLPGIRLMYSDDGIKWTRGRKNEQMPAQDFSAAINHNPGLVGDCFGHGYMTMFYTYGNNDMELGQPNVYLSTVQYDMREMDWGRLTISIE